MGGEIVKKFPYLKEGCSAMSGNGVEPGYGGIRRNQVYGMMKEIVRISYF